MHSRTHRVVALRIVPLVASVALAACASDADRTEGSPAAAVAPHAEGAPEPRAAAKTRPAPDLARPHPFGVHDMVRMERVGAPVPSPDGRWIAFTRQAWDPDANQKTTNLWLVSPDGETTKQLTAAKGVADGAPVWAPDSKSLLFTSSRDGGGKVWAMRVDGGEPRKFLELPVGVGDLRLSPTGAHLAFAAEVFPDASAGKEMEETAKRDAERAKSPVKARTYDQLMVRHWDAWDEGKRNHLFVVPLTWGADGEPALAGEPLDLMRGVDGDCPTRPFGGSEDFVFAPDGKELAYVTQLGPDQAWSTNLDVFTVSVEGGAATCVTAENRATDRGPAYSPDGTTLAWLAMARAGFEADRQVIQLRDRQAGTTRTLTPNWDRSVDAALWLPNSHGLLCVVDEEARRRVYAVDAVSGQRLPVLTEHWNDGLALLPGTGEARARLVFTQNSLLAPTELFRSELDGSDRLRLTRVNDARMDLARTSEPKEFWFDGAEGAKVHAWLLEPVGFEATDSAGQARKYPLAFVIHGGPQGAIGDQFHYRWNLQAFAGAGYGVLAVNFHGSTGFGQAFTDSISRDWGGKPLEDLMKGLDAAIEQHAWIDADRVGALGASYGGWMINWINGHTDRFKALVCHDGGFDEAANYFTTEELWFPEWEFGGVPWENPELFEKFSPSRHVANWKTPTLVIHGANDFRLIDAEGIAAFTALQRRGVPSRLLWFPDENHWVQKPLNSIFWHQNVIEWLDRWLLAPPKS
jgi:dipeptidyl aminopeptidase/acylaminoacyl peptidase